MDKTMKPKLSVYLSDHVAKRLTLAATRPGTNKSAIVDAALDRFLNPERDRAAMQLWCAASIA